MSVTSSPVRSSAHWLAWPVADDVRPWVYAMAAGLAAVAAAALLARALGVLWPKYQRRFMHGVARQLHRAHIYVDASRLLALNVGLAAGATVLVYLLTGRLAPAVVVALACGCLPRVLLWWLRHRRVAALRLQLPDIAMLLAGGLRAGMSLNQAIAQAAAEMPVPLRQELELMLREQRLGASFEAALAGLERRAPLEETTLLCAALRISRQTGGHLAQTLESLADALRRKIALEGKIRSLTAQGRLQGWAMGLLPLLCGLALAAIEPEGMSLLFTSPLGWATCSVLLVMQGVGLYCLRRVVRIDV
jgi:tight adherence protein B